MCKSVSLVAAEQWAEKETAVCDRVSQEVELDKVELQDARLKLLHATKKAANVEAKVALSDL